MKNNVNTGSIREYAIAYIENEMVGSCPRLFLDDIISNQNEYEYMYAIKDEMDRVLDLKVGERLHIKFNRDNPDSDGFIKRIK